MLYLFLFEILAFWNSFCWVLSFEYQILAGRTVDYPNLHQRCGIQKASIIQKFGITFSRIPICFLNLNLSTISLGGGVKEVFAFASKFPYVFFFYIYHCTIISRRTENGLCALGLKKCYFFSPSAISFAAK